MVRRLAMFLVVFMALLGGANDLWSADVTYTYDDLGRLIGADYPSGHHVIYSYDAAGNRASVVISVANQPPNANDDSIVTAKNVPKTFDPRTNDSDADKDPITITAVTDAPKGTTSKTATSVTYTPDNNYIGADSFTYTISDGQGHTDTANVSVTVQAGFTFNQTIAADTSNYNVATAATAGGWNGTQPLVATITINSGRYVGSTSLGAAFVVPSLPSGSTVTIVNNGFIVGKGGNGGGGNGSPGGLALSVAYQTTINNLNGVVGGGGGGGGRGAAWFNECDELQGSGGGGGGRGSDPGLGGAAFGGDNGEDATQTAAGGGGSGFGGGDGGAGGNLGQPGVNGQNSGGATAFSGGAAGAATSGNSFITWTNVGQRLGALN